MNLQVLFDLESDPGQWLRTNVRGAVNDFFDELNIERRKKEAAIKAAREEVSRIDGLIAAARKEVEADRETTTRHIDQAKANVEKINKDFKNIGNHIRWLNGKLRENGNKRKRIHYWWFGHKHKRVWDAFASGACGSRKIGHDSDRTASEIARGSLILSRDVAVKVLETAKEGLNLTPIDLDPRVAGIFIVRDAAYLALDFKKIVDPALAGLTAAAEQFKLRRGFFRGSLNAFADKQPILLIMDFDLFGKRFSTRLAFSPTNAAYTAKQLSLLALMVLVKKVEELVEKIPGSEPVLAEIQAAFLKAQQKRAKEASKIVVAKVVEPRKARTLLAKVDPAKSAPRKAAPAKVSPGKGATQQAAPAKTIARKGKSRKRASREPDLRQPVQAQSFLGNVASSMISRQKAERKSLQRQIDQRKGKLGKDTLAMLADLPKSHKRSLQACIQYPHGKRGGSFITASQDGTGRMLTNARRCRVDQRHAILDLNGGRLRSGDEVIIRSRRKRKIESPRGGKTRVVRDFFGWVDQGRGANNFVSAKSYWRLGAENNTAPGRYIIEQACDRAVKGTPIVSGDRITIKSVAANGTIRVRNPKSGGLLVVGGGRAKPFMVKGGEDIRPDVFVFFPVSKKRRYKIRKTGKLTRCIIPGIWKGGTTAGFQCKTKSPGFPKMKLQKFYRVVEKIIFCTKTSISLVARIKAFGKQVHWFTRNLGLQP